MDDAGGLPDDYMTYNIKGVTYIVGSVTNTAENIEFAFVCSAICYSANGFDSFVLITPTALSSSTVFVVDLKNR